jgi:HD superfamily phosphohydrolase
MFLMCQAVDVLRQKGVEITAEEEQSTIIAILLHDIGHGPFSHALENCIVHNMNHEDLTELFFEALDQEFGGALGVAYQIYQDRYPKRFLHQLVSSQLDVDRLDYLSRDSFFTGVSEGIVGTERIIKMLNVAHDNLVVDIKGIYSVEKFVLSRRLMYWQVYLHKTVVGAEQLLIKVLRRAEFLTKSGAPIFLTPSFREFFEHNYTFEDFRRDPKILSLFANLDDDEVMTSIKIWQNHSDKVLSILAKQLINRSLFRVDFLDEPLSSAQLSDLRKSAMNRYQVSLEESEYFVFEGQISNSAYSNSESKINVLLRDGSLLDLAEASDQLNIDTLTKIVTKHFICYPKM